MSRQSSVLRRSGELPDGQAVFDIFELAHRLGWTAAELSALRSIYERAVALDNGHMPPSEDPKCSEGSSA